MIAAAGRDAGDDGTFEVHAQTVEDQACKVWASVDEYRRCRPGRPGPGDLLRHHGSE